MGRNKQKNTFGLMFGVLVLMAIVILGLTFSIGGNTNKSNTDGQQAVTSQIQCSKDYAKDVSFIARDSFEKGTSVNNVTYSVWKDLDGVKIPQANANGQLTVGYGETYEVVATADGYQNGFATFSVDSQCNGPTDKVFYLTKLPTSVDSTFENSKITGPNSVSNAIPTGADITRNVKATFNGMSKTSADAIIVIDANKDEFTIDSSLASATQPNAHTTITNYKSYSYNLGKFDGSSDVLANFDITGDKDLVAGNYNVTYTIYTNQNGYVDSDSGEYVNTPSVEDNNDVVLNPTFTGTIYFTAN